MHTTYAKDFAVVVEPFEGGVEGIEGIFCENVLAGNIAKVKECSKCLDDVHVYVAFECARENLARIKYSGITCGVIYYLHKGFRVVASPLFEVASLFESSKARKERRECNTIEKLEST